MSKCLAKLLSHVQAALTCVRIRDGHFPNADVTRDAAEELPERQRNDELEVIAPIHVRVLPNAEKFEERAAIDGDGQQLDHRQGLRVGKLAENQLS